MFVSQEGPANALHLSCNRNFDQVRRPLTYMLRKFTMPKEGLQTINLNPHH